MFSKYQTAFVFLLTKFILAAVEKNRWENFAFGDQTNPLYVNDSIEVFLKLCGRLDHEKCPEVDDPKKCIEECNKQELGKESRLKALQHAKEKVYGFQNHINNPLRTGLLFVIIIACCVGGIYLGVVGHFRWQNLPLIGNWLLDSPTDGIKFRHYLWMKWIILGNTNIHWLTHMKSDTEIFSWTPLNKLPWDRPETPTDIRNNEPRDVEHPVWIIENIASELGVATGDSTLDEGWERDAKNKLNNTANTTGIHHKIHASNHPHKQISKKISENHSKSSKVEKKKDEQDDDELVYQVLEEYWLRINTWAWARYRYKNDPLLDKKEAPSVRTIADDDDY